MPLRHILVVVVDGLRASALGAYGNTTYPTPALDQFAAESLLFDSCFATSPNLVEVYDSLWRSLHPVAGDTSGAAPSLPNALRDAGYETVLVTDSEEVLSHGVTETFSRSWLLADATPASRATEIDQM